MTRILLPAFILIHILLLDAIEQVRTEIPKDFDYEHWPYPFYEEVSSRLKELASKYPKFARTYSIGKSGEGRDLIVIEITNEDTGPGESKPALWIQAGIHAREASGRQIVLYFIQRLLESSVHNSEETNCWILEHFTLCLFLTLTSVKRHLHDTLHGRAISKRIMKEEIWMEMVISPPCV